MLGSRWLPETHTNAQALGHAAEPTLMIDEEINNKKAFQVGGEYCEFTSSPRELV
jgi:hypothetical protein